ncbi:MAG: hypothetical protein ACLQBK_15180 [Candidatus Sulfotelmatobacter sp.]
MRDWRELVKERLAARGRLGSALGSAEEEVVAELAAHLEEAYEDARSRGLAEEAAVQLALQEVEDWRVLAVDICLAKAEEGGMNDRTKSLWLPGLVNLIAAPGLLMILQKLGVHPRVVWVGSMAMVFYLPWLITLSIFGALGALLAKRAQGSTGYRLVAGLAPALAILGAYALFLPLGLVLGRPHISEFPWVYFVLTLLNWVGLPAGALMLGALPFLRELALPRSYADQPQR